MISIYLNGGSVSTLSLSLYIYTLPQRQMAVSGRLVIEAEEMEGGGWRFNPLGFFFYVFEWPCHVRAEGNNRGALLGNFGNSFSGASEGFLTYKSAPRKTGWRKEMETNETSIKYKIQTRVLILPLSLWTEENIKQIHCDSGLYYIHFSSSYLCKNANQTYLLLSRLAEIITLEKKIYLSKKQLYLFN